MSLSIYGFPALTRAANSFEANQGVDEPNRCGCIAFRQGAVPTNGGSKLEVLRVYIGPVGRAGSRDLLETIATVESVKVVFAPSAPPASHGLQ